MGRNRELKKRQRDVDIYKNKVKIKTRMYEQTEDYDESINLRASDEVNNDYKIKKEKDIPLSKTPASIRIKKFFSENSLALFIETFVIGGIAILIPIAFNTKMELSSINVRLENIEKQVEHLEDSKIDRNEIELQLENIKEMLRWNVNNKKMEIIKNELEDIQSKLNEQ